MASDNFLWVRYPNLAEKQGDQLARPQDFLTACLPGDRECVCANNKAITAITAIEHSTEARFLSRKGSSLRGQKNMVLAPSVCLRRMCLAGVCSSRFHFLTRQPLSHQGHCPLSHITRLVKVSDQRKPSSTPKVWRKSAPQPTSSGHSTISVKQL